MTTLSRRVRWLAPPVTIALALGIVGALATPASAAKTTFSSATDIHAGDPGYTQTQTTDITIPSAGSGNPFPSSITVPATETILDVNVTLNLSHTWPDDIDVMLVGPGGQNAIVMSDVGSSLDISDVNLVLDDEAAISMPSAQLTSQSYQPTNLGGGDTFPGAPAPSGNTALSVFDGTSAAGTWNLYVQDDTGPDSGTVNSWSVTFALAADPSPSTISVSGLPQVSDVNVGLQGITSEAVDDLNLLVVGPGGQQSYLIGDSGGSNDIADVNVTFDDEAATDLPNSDPLVNGTSYKPFLQGDIETFPGGPPASGSSTLTVFDGLSPNGEWRLFAMDDANGDLTTISGWSLDFTWADTLNPTGSVAINGGAASTNTTSVTLNVSATDPAPASGVKEMRFSNDGVTFSAYQPYAATAAWTLTTGDGVKTVSAQFRDNDGNQSAVVTDAITLTLPDTTAPTVTKTTPKKNATGVKVTTKVKVKVSEALKGSTVTKKTVFLKAKGSSNKVKAKVTYNSSKKMIVLTPNKALKKNKKYNVTVTTKVKDVAGNAFDAKPSKSGAQALKFSFTTA
jgi:subtilisin-like proprotein convertase family protein